MPHIQQISDDSTWWDLVVMSIELYEMLNGKVELYRQLDEGRNAVIAGEKRSFRM